MCPHCEPQLKHSQAARCGKEEGSRNHIYRCMSASERGDMTCPRSHGCGMVEPDLVCESSDGLMFILLYPAMSFIN